MTLQPNTTLQSGKYIIKIVLGQGGFGITYLAEQTLLDGKVAIKEFFMKELCEREESTYSVTLGTSSNRELVERCRQKFLKEARTIFKLNHPNIVRILDVFEENGTAYYVMDYIEGESLADMVKRRGALPEAEALTYVKEVGKALMYVHNKKINHLDIKPSNIMRREEDGQIMLIDFGVSKQYDLVTSEGTSTTPVGISRGYSPAEQYRQHGVQTFSPQSDVYALAATLYKLLTGVTPPEAMEVLDEGLPIGEMQGRHVSASVIAAIQHAMKGRLERTQSVEAFLSELGSATEKEGEETKVVEVIPSKTETESKRDSQPVPVTPDISQEHAMKGRLERTQSVEAFLSESGSATEKESEETEAVKVIPPMTETEPKRDSQPVPVTPDVSQGQKPKPEPQPQSEPEPISKPFPTLKIIAGVAAALLIGLLAILLGRGNNSEESDYSEETDYFAQEDRSFTATFSDGVLTCDGVRYKMVRVEGGTFTMGATEEQGSDAWTDEKNVHKVTLSTYSIGETEVTQELWEAVMGSNPSVFKGAKHPVENVSWDDCQDFIRKLNVATGKRFRLPTEAEWEYAARGGNQSRGYKYSGSNNIKSVAWYEKNSYKSSSPDGSIKVGLGTHAVAEKQSNELGLYDMSGNVWEWCSDWYDNYNSWTVTNPMGPESGSGRVCRGGSYSHNADFCRLSYRSDFDPSTPHASVGLRLALSN